MKAKNKRKRDGDQKFRYVFRTDWGDWRRWIRRHETAAIAEQKESNQ